ncbi:hypothetical protein HII31_13687 [Pseudocercospora fuligena]|uniref:Uncharacterized protein n=1 Tax=Pseudocercospora fuligena TaxID=685502 RepID=A0A8H6R4J9_9PEZI|nr:hypothetical protein HII31_13687 [Pseudocercospora fuligena]
MVSTPDLGSTGVLSSPDCEPSGPDGALTENRMKWLLESSLRIASTQSANTLALSTTISAIGFPMMLLAVLPVTSCHDGLTHRTLPSRSSSRIALRDCSAAFLRSSRSSRMSMEIVLSICPFSGVITAASSLRASTAGGTSVACGCPGPGSAIVSFALYCLLSCSL